MSNQQKLYIQKQRDHRETKTKKKKQQPKQSGRNNKRKKVPRIKISLYRLELSNCNLTVVSRHGLFFEANFHF